MADEATPRPTVSGFLARLPLTGVLLMLLVAWVAALSGSGGDDAVIDLCSGAEVDGEPCRQRADTVASSGDGVADAAPGRAAFVRPPTLPATDGNDGSSPTATRPTAAVDEPSPRSPGDPAMLGATSEAGESSPTATLPTDGAGESSPRPAATVGPSPTRAAARSTAAPSATPTPRSTPTPTTGATPTRSELGDVPTATPAGGAPGSTPSPVPPTPTRIAATATAVAAATATAVPPIPTATAVPATPTATASPDPTATPSPTIVPSGPQPVGQPGAWTLVFEDNFDYLDEQTWETAWFSSFDYTRPVNSAGGACFHPNQVSVVSGDLQLRIDPIDDPRCLQKDGVTRADYVAGLVNTRESFTFSYGYAEARVFLPGAAGSLDNWAAFWHTGFDWPTTGEVDIVEGLSEGQPCSVYHWAGSGGEHLQAKQCVNWPEPAGWHVFAADWQPGRITFYYDGVEVFTTTEGVTGDPHYLILNYTVRANGVGTSVPSTMAVDYVRVWQN